MAITKDDFNKIWASTSPLTPYSFSEPNYKEGWNFIGATPPARQMWDFLQKNNDEKMQFIVNNMLVPPDIDETANSGNYYTYTVPSEKVFADFNSIGGKTIAWNQLVDTGTSSVTLISGHKYYTLVSGSASIQTGAGSVISVTGGTDKVTDLTLAFGSGNEPSVADFQALFPNYASEGYNAGTLLSAGVSNVISKDSSNNVVANMPIPSAIQSLPLYGASAGTAKNYIDFANKKYVQNVGSVDLGTLTWYNTGSIFNAPTPANAKSVTLGGINAKCSAYVVASSTNEYTSNDKISTVANANISATSYIMVKDSAYSDATTFKTAMSGVMLYYELATSVETDISDLLGASGIACESGGTLTFANSNGSNYRIPVPVNLDWLDGTDGLMTVQDKAKLEVAYEAVNVPLGKNAYSNTDYLPLNDGILLKDRDVPIIPDNSDLNTYTTAGTYRTTGASGSASLSNCPVTSTAIKLLVIEVGYGNSAYCMQVIFGTYRNIYIRSRTNTTTPTTWTAWGRLNYTDV